MKFYADIDRKIEVVAASRERAVALGHAVSIRVYDGWLANLREQQASLAADRADKPVQDDKPSWYDKEADRW